MKFQKGNKIGKGRPEGSKNRMPIDKRDLISEVAFDPEQFKEEWDALSLHERWEIRIKLAKYVIAEPKEEARSNNDIDLPLFVDSKEDAWRLLQLTENGDTEQVGGSIVFE
jgi:hypothetical protein|tara:strand:+ start:177 stop:509 length:333 start_codon:yes stop_codon:yes gene_type:complete